MAKISDFELLKLLQSELVEILIERKNTEKWFARSCCKAKIHRLRLQIQASPWLSGENRRKSQLTIQSKP